MTTIQWEFTSDEIDAIGRAVGEYRRTPFVAERIDTNVDGDAPEISRARFWDAHLTAQLTSQQRSGPDSSVARFIQEDLETLGLEACEAASDVEALVASTLEDHGGVRFYNNVGEACEQNYRLLFEEGGWDDIARRLEPLRANRERNPRSSDARSDAEGERDVCRFLYAGVGEDGLHRIGPKQSRNLLQVLGFTRYETPLDSRISKWLDENLDLPYHVSGGGLGNPEFYDFHMDLVQAVCREAEQLPCVFDAAVFASYDDGGWSEEAAGATF